MKQRVTTHIKREKAIGLAAAIALHSVVLYFLLSYHIIPPPSEALTVFVNYVNLTAPANVTAPTQQKPVLTKQESPQAPVPTAPKILASEAPIISKSEPVVPAPPVTRIQPIPVQMSAPVVSRPVIAPSPHEGGTQMPQTVHLSGELSVACTDRTAPSYPKQSIRLGEQGKTILLVELNELGHVTNVEIKTKSGFPRLDEAAVNAVKTWRCNPAKRNGVAVRSIALQPFNFTLKGR
ncbi:MAG: energy transducer TonB [Desulfuromonadaceae bacterium]|nr:energy transducer TonB [Desulfuromonadaceae bacterium]